MLSMWIARWTWWPAVTLVLALASQPAQAVAADLFIAERPDAERWDGVGFAGLDPATLEDVGVPANVKSPASTIMAPRDWALSADGSTLASFESAWNVEAQRREYVLVVRDGLLGPERARFPVPDWLGFPRLSRDGRRLMAERRDENGEPRPGTYVIDTADGHVLPAMGQASLAPAWTELDPNGRYLLRVEPPSNPGLPLRIRLHDLDTGSQAGQLDLAWPATSWPTGSLAPDGRRLALIEPSSQQVTLVTLPALQIERTFSLSSPPSALDWFLDWSLLAPRVAHAKPEHGGALEARFTADGAALYVFGAEAIAVSPDQWSERGLGVRLLDLNQERVVASGLRDQFVGRVLSTADGQATYTFGLASTEDPRHLSWGAHFVLRRLDPLTLDVLASREFVGSRTLLVWPAAVTIGP
jgi:hypothetical protein